MSVLDIADLSASIDGKKILQNLSLRAHTGEIHLLIGPNGAGKSTFARVLAGAPNYEVEALKCSIDGESLLHMTSEERAHQGLFVSFQHPVEIPGLMNEQFLRLAYNAHRKAQGLEPMAPSLFHSLVEQYREALGISPELLRRELHVGFSGGEKKRNEMLQVLLFQPKVVIFDEIDSGVDLDAMRIIVDKIKELSSKSIVVVISHYPQFIAQIQPDYVHIMSEGRLVHSGGEEVVAHVEKDGYDAVCTKRACD